MVWYRDSKQQSFCEPKAYPRLALASPEMLAILWLSFSCHLSHSASTAYLEKVIVLNFILIFFTFNGLSKGANYINIASLLRVMQAKT